MRMHEVVKSEHKGGSRNMNQKQQQKTHTKSSKTALVKGGTKQEGLTSKGQEEIVRDVK